MRRLVVGLIVLAGVPFLTGPGTAVATELHCFSNPSVCGYPDPSTVGLSNPSALEPSGSIAVTTAGTTIANKDVSGTIEIYANNVTIENTRVTGTSNCGATTNCGNYDIRVGSGLTGVKIKNVETRAESGKTCAQDVRSNGNGLVIENSYLHACDGNLWAGGSTTLKNSYGIAKLGMSTDHVFNVYFNKTDFTAIHDTLLNPTQQTAVIFGDVNSGSVGPCTNHLIVEGSLLAGGAYVMYPCANGSTFGKASRVIVNNHFARCLTTVIFESPYTKCKEGADSNGYYPYGGSFGLMAYDPGGTWKGNVWDDNGAEATP